jgi:hypothetical protein
MDVFASVDRGILVETPYPHLMIEDALPDDLAATLLSEIPPLEVFARDAPLGSNVRFPLPSPIALADPRVSPRWKQAIEACNAAGQALLDRFIARLGKYVLAAHPDFEARFGPIEHLRAVPRFGPRARNEVGMDMQMVANSPALRDGTRVRGPHLDQPDKLISALLYLRPPDDDSTGAELELYEPVDGGPLFNEVNETGFEKVRHVLTYPYRHNLFILPASLPTSLHGVSPRARTWRPRYHLHIVGEMSGRLFDIPRAPAAAAPP